MRALTSKSWGRKKHLFMKSKLQIGVEVFDSTSQTNLKSLEIIQYFALRIITGFCKLTLILSLQCESQITSLCQSFELKSTRYFYKILNFPSNHVMYKLFSSQGDQILETK